MKKALDAEEEVGKVKVEKILEYVGGILDVLSNVKQVCDTTPSLHPLLP